MEKKIAEKKSIEKKILEAISQILEETGSEIDEVTRESNFIEDLDFSSLDVMEVISFLEDEFHLRVKDKELQSIMTVGQLIQFVEDKL